MTATPTNRIITVNLPSQEQIDRRARTTLASVESLTIDCDSMLEVAADELRTIKTDYAKLEAARVHHVSPLNEEVKYINNWFRGALTMMDQAEGALKRKMLNYQNEQERLRREAQVKLDNELRLERERIEKENRERERLAVEESNRKLAEQAAALRLEEDARREVEAQKKAIADALNEGNAATAAAAEKLLIEAKERQAAALALADTAVTEAAAIQNEAAAATAASEIVSMTMTGPILSVVPKLAGIATKTTYKGKCSNLLDLVKFIAAHPEHLNLVKANDTAINQLAKAQQMSCKVEGILVYEDKTLAARSA